MAVPNRKVSKARRDKRRASTWKAVIPGMSECPQCHELKLPHRVCKNCGFYDGKQVIEVEKSEAEAKAAAKEEKKAAKAAKKAAKAEGTVEEAVEEKAE